jgi:ubiquinone/menaquinone biosynthesis C-methylase UbiE
MQSTPSSSESRDQFDRQAALYAASPVHRHGPSLPVLVEFAQPKAGEKALDVATGTGNAAFAVADQGAVVVGLDVATKMLDQARKRAEEEGYSNVTFEVGAAEAMPFPDETFSLVVVRHAPHHFRDAGLFLKEVYRVLKPGGRFVMADQVSPTEDPEVASWIHTWQQTRDTSHFMQRTIPQWKELASAAGLDWVRDTLVPYRMETDWWFRQSGADDQAVAKLVAHAESAPQKVRDAATLEFDESGKVKAFTDQMLVVEMRKA